MMEMRRKFYESVNFSYSWNEVYNNKTQRLCIKNKNIRITIGLDIHRSGNYTWKIE